MQLHGSLLIYRARRDGTLTWRPTWPVDHPAHLARSRLSPALVEHRFICSLFVFVEQYGIKKKVPIEPSQDPALEGRLGRKKKTPEELAADAQLAEQEAARSSMRRVCLCYAYSQATRNE